MKIGIEHVAGAVIGAGAGFGVGAIVNDVVSDDAIPRLDRARADWRSFNAKLEAQFPGRRLDSPAAHRRFAEFIAGNPAPPWVTVTTEGRNYIDVRSDVDPLGEGEGGGKGAVIGGVTGLLMGVGGVQGVLRKPAYPHVLGRGACAFAAVAGAALAGTTLVGLLQLPSQRKLSGEVDATSVAPPSTRR